MVFDCEAVQLKDKLAVGYEALIFGASVITPAAEETLIQRLLPSTSVTAMRG